MPKYEQTCTRDYQLMFCFSHAKERAREQELGVAPMPTIPRHQNHSYCAVTPTEHSPFLLWPRQQSISSPWSRQQSPRRPSHQKSSAHLKIHAEQTQAVSPNLLRRRLPSATVSPNLLRRCLTANHQEIQNLRVLALHLMMARSGVANQTKRLLRLHLPGLPVTEGAPQPPAPQLPCLQRRFSRRLLLHCSTTYVACHCNEKLACRQSVPWQFAASCVPVRHLTAAPWQQCLAETSQSCDA